MGRISSWGYRLHISGVLLGRVESWASRHCLEEVITNSSCWFGLQNRCREPPSPLQSLREVCIRPAMRPYLKIRIFSVIATGSWVSQATFTYEESLQLTPTVRAQYLAHFKAVFACPGTARCRVCVMTSESHQRMTKACRLSIFAQAILYLVISEQAKTSLKQARN